MEPPAEEPEKEVDQMDDTSAEKEDCYKWFWIWLLGFILLVILFARFLVWYWEFYENAMGDRAPELQFHWTVTRPVIWSACALWFVGGIVLLIRKWRRARGAKEKVVE